jgi:hypothetical protein
MRTNLSFWTRKYGSCVLESQYNRGRVTTQQLCGCIRSQRHLFSTDDASKETAEVPKTRLEDGGAGRRRLLQYKVSRESWKEYEILMGEPLLKPAGALIGPDIYQNDYDDSHDQTNNEGKKQKVSKSSYAYIPEVSLYEGEGRVKKRILVLCTGGTLTMAPAPNQGGALAPVEGAISKYMTNMEELNSPDLPFEYHLHEYSPFRDSSDLGPADWATLAHDIKVRKKTTSCLMMK